MKPDTSRNGDGGHEVSKPGLHSSSCSRPAGIWPDTRDGRILTAGNRVHASLQGCPLRGGGEAEWGWALRFHGGYRRNGYCGRRRSVPGAWAASPGLLTDNQFGGRDRSDPLRCTRDHFGLSVGTQHRSGKHEIPNDRNGLGRRAGNSGGKLSAAFRHPARQSAPKDDFGCRRRPGQFVGRRTPADYLSVSTPGRREPVSAHDFGDRAGLWSGEPVAG